MVSKVTFVKITTQCSDEMSNRCKPPPSIFYSKVTHLLSSTTLFRANFDGGAYYEIALIWHKNAYYKSNFLPLDIYTLYQNMIFNY